MNSKVAAAIIGVVVVLAGIIIWQMRAQPGSNALLAEEFTWSFVDRGVVASTSIPKTDVALRVAGVDVPLGTYDGTCTAIAGSQWPLLAHELSGAICYFAGSGKEIGIFEEGSKLVLKEGDVSEGDAEHPGTRNNFVVLSKQPTF